MKLCLIVFLTGRQERSQVPRINGHAEMVPAKYQSTTSLKIPAWTRDLFSPLHNRFKHPMPSSHLLQQPKIIYPSWNLCLRIKILGDRFCIFSSRRRSYCIRIPGWNCQGENKRIIFLSQRQNFKKKDKKTKTEKTNTKKEKRPKKQRPKRQPPKRQRPTTRGWLPPDPRMDLSRWLQHHFNPSLSPSSWGYFHDPHGHDNVAGVPCPLRPFQWKPNGDQHGHTSCLAARASSQDWDGDDDDEEKDDDDDGDDDNDDRQAQSIER